jgi:hypothetical protein
MWMYLKRSMVNRPLLVRLIFWCHFSSTHHCSENIAAKRSKSQSKDRHKRHLAPHKIWLSPLLYPVCNNFLKVKWTRSRGQTRSGYFTIFWKTILVKTLPLNNVEIFPCHVFLEKIFEKFYSYNTTLSMFVCSAPSRFAIFFFFLLKIQCRPNFFKFWNLMQ